MSDELAAKRRTARPNGIHLTEEESRASGRTEVRPPLWRWFSVQTAHTVQHRAAAARHVKERFNLAYIRFSSVDRALAKEESEHLVGFRELMDEYRELFDIPADDDDFARQTGVGGKMVPFTIEMCEKCAREAIPGTGMCGRHGGQWISEKDQADISRRIHERLLIGAVKALQVLEDILDNERSGHVRVQAAAMLLDRAGIGAHINVNHSGSVTIQATDEATQAIEARLAMIALNIQQRAELEARQPTVVAGLGDIIDAEVVEA